MPTFSNTTSVAIPDNTTVTSTINVSGVTGLITDLNLTTFITHTFNADLDFFLISPTGTRVEISTDNGTGNDNVFNGTVWDDEAATAVTSATFANNVTATLLRPEGLLSAFDGQDPNGTWTLEITDDLGGDTGNLSQWTLDFSAGVPPIATFTPADDATNVPVANNLVITFDEPIRNLNDSEITNENVANLIGLCDWEGGECGDDVPFTATINAEKTQIVIDPDSNLNFFDDYGFYLAPVEDSTNLPTTSQGVIFTTAAQPPAPAPTPIPTPVIKPFPAGPGSGGSAPAPAPAPTPTPAPAPAPAPWPTPESASAPIFGAFLDQGLLGGQLDIRLPSPAPDTCGTGIDDVMMGDASANSFCGAGGQDVIAGFEGEDFLTGDDGNDVIFGNTENDTMAGGNGEDSIFAGKGDDLAKGDADSDILMGDFGLDTLGGNEGDDTMFGNADRDILDGNQGNDFLLGGQDNDTLIGGSGQDILSGDFGDDSLVGGVDRDRFDFHPGDGSDIIADFQDGFDLIGLQNGLSFEQLQIVQFGNDTQITALGLTITLQGINVGAIDSTDFVAV